MSLQQTIIAALLANRDVLNLPRWRVMADIREVYGCNGSTAGSAYAAARVHAHARTRRHTAPYVRQERSA